MEEFVACFAEGDLGGMVQQPGPGVAGGHLARDPDDGGDMRMPVAIVQFAGGSEHGDAAAFVAVARFVVAVGGAMRRRGVGNVGDLLVQGRLVVLHLDDQVDADVGGDLEKFS
jgi:hypothetical protein